MQLTKAMLEQRVDHVYDTLVVGGGTAGLSAGIYDTMNRTSHPRIFAVGDLKVDMNQVAIAAADGTQAATQIWRDICRVEGTRRAPVSINAA